jgi:hypothetical protein
VTRFWLILVAAMAATWSELAAQSAPPVPDAAKVGDWWTYDQRDEITGFPLDSYTSAITEISAKEIVTKLSFRGRNQPGTVVFDHEWNRIVIGNLSYRPNDGHGVRLPLTVGNEWKTDFEERNLQSGVNMKGVSLSKVAAQESVTTPAGTFDTFRIERQVKEFNATDPSRSIEMQFVLWYAPQIDHWVRRTAATRVDKRLRSNSSDELIEFGHKP